MADQNEIEVKITGTTGDLDNDIAQVETKVKNAAKGMRESANIIKAAFADIKNSLKNVEVKIHVDTAALQTTMQGVVNTIKTRLQAASSQAAVKVKVDRTNLATELNSVKTQIQSKLASLPPQKIKLQVDAAAVQASLRTVVSGMPLIDLNINLPHLQTQIASVRTILSSAFNGNNGAIKLKFDRAHLQSELAVIRAKINSFFATSVNGVRLNISVTQADLAAARAKLRSLTTTIFKAKVGIDLAYLNAQIAHARAMLGAMGSSLNINVDATATGLITAINNLKAEIVRLISAMNSGGGGGGSGGGSGGGGFGAIFGGNLAAMATSFVTSKLMEMGKALITTSDDAALLNSRMLDLLGTEQEVAEVKDQLYAAAQRLQAGYKDMAAATARMIPSLQEMGKGAGDAVKLAEVMMTSAKLSGASTMEAASSAQQFSQALGSGVLAGDELKSILENNQTLARTLANALKLPDASTKVTLGMLKQLGSEGKITSEVLANALLNSYDSIMAKADQLPKTFSGMWQQVKNIAFKAVDDLNQLGVFDGVKSAISDFTASFSQLSKDGSIKEWGVGIKGILDALMPVFQDLLGVVTDVLGDITGLWADLTGSIEEGTGVQITIFDILKAAVNGVGLVFVLLRTGIQAAFGLIKYVVREAVLNVIARFNDFLTGIDRLKVNASYALDILKLAFKNFAETATKALHLDFKGVLESWNSNFNKLEQLTKQRTNRLNQINQEAQTKQDAIASGRADNQQSLQKSLSGVADGVSGWLGRVMGGQSPQAESKKPASISTTPVTKVAVGAGKPTKEKKPKAEKSQMSDLGQGLEAQKTEWENQQNAAGTLQEFPLEKVREYWQNVLATKKLSADDQLKVEKNLAEANHAIRQRSLNDEITAKRQELQDYSQNISAKLVKAQAYAERLKAIYGAQSGEYKQALQEQQQLEEDVRQKAYQQSLRDSERNQQFKLNDVDAAEAQMQHEYDLGLMSDKKRLEALRIFEQQRYEITQAAIKDRIALYDTENERTSGKLSPDDRLKIVDQKNDSDTDHTKNQKGFDMQAEAQKMESMFGGLGDRVSNLWDQGLQSMMNGTLTWRNAMNAIFADMGAFFVQKLVSEPLKHYMAGLARRLLIKMGVIKTEVAAETAGQTAQTGATIVGETTRTGATAAGGALRIGLKAMEAIKGVMLSAWEAMAGAWAAMVQIPIVGPIIAPVVAAGTFAGVAALAGKIKSASGGYDIPAGVNPVTQLHEEEMVLPKPYANVIRDMASGGSGGAANGSSAMGGTVEQNQFNISALDAKSLKKLLRQNPGAVAAGLKAYGRNFGSR